MVYNLSKLLADFNNTFYSEEKENIDQNIIRGSICGRVVKTANL